jgi:hypothetical protein
VPGVRAADSTSPVERSAGYHTHDGFYLSAHLGLGWYWVKPPAGDPISGTGRPLALSVGFAPSGRLVLFGEAYRVTLIKPTVSGNPLANLDLQGVGPGLKYYFMPRNIFLSSTVLFTRMTYQNGSPGDERYGFRHVSPWGFMGRASLGKEWWVSPDWGLGLAAEAFVGRMDDTVKGVSLLVSASFN